MPNEQESVINIDGKDYPLNSLSDEAKAQLQSYRFTEQEIARLKAQLAMAQTALKAYRQGVLESLPTDQ